MLDKKYHEKKFTKSAFNQAVACPMQAYYYRNSSNYAYHFDGVDGIAEVGDQFGALARIYEGIPDTNIICADITNDEKDNHGHFFVPENVYIIGTMNDIDRSVESMDFAMRRRLAFEEITAKQSQDSMFATTEKWKDRKPQKQPSSAASKNF